jgi:hypothetical protein
MNGKIHLNNVDIGYWIDEYPEIQQGNYQTETFILKEQPEGKNNIVTKKLALELYLHRNANNYGLLCMEYESIELNSYDESKLVINYTQDNEVPYTSTLFEYSSYMYCGLPEELIQPIKESVEMYIDRNKVNFSGILKISNAVNSEVGSSPMFFSIMVEIMLNVLEQINNTDKVEKVIKDAFCNSRFFNN